MTGVVEELAEALKELLRFRLVEWNEISSPLGSAVKAGRLAIARFNAERGDGVWRSMDTAPMTNPPIPPAVVETNVKHKIFLEELPTTSSAPCVQGGWFGPVPGVRMNEAIYCRVSSDKAWAFDEDEAVRRIIYFNAKGYRCHAEPAIHVTY